MKHKLVVTGIEWPSFNHGVETWVLWVCECGCAKRRIEKIDGKWSANALDLEIISLGRLRAGKEQP